MGFTIDKIFRERESLFLVLGSCLADEAAARPETIRAAIRELIRSGQRMEEAGFTPVLATGRYGEDLREEAGKAFLAPNSDLQDAGEALLQAVWWQTNESQETGYAVTAARLMELLKSPETLSRCEGALGCVQLFFELSRLPQSVSESWPETLRQVAAAILPMLFSDEMAMQYGASLSLIWLGACRNWTPPSDPDVLGRLFSLYRYSPSYQIRFITSWALASQPLAPRNERRCATVPLTEFEGIVRDFATLEGSDEKAATLIVAWYLNALDNVQLAQQARALLKDVEARTTGRTLRELLEQLGEKP